MGWNRDGEWEDDYDTGGATTGDTPLPTPPTSAGSSPFNLNATASRTDAPVKAGDAARINEYQDRVWARMLGSSDYDTGGATTGDTPLPPVGHPSEPFGGGGSAPTPPTSAGTSPFDLNAMASRTGAPVEAGDAARIKEYQDSMAVGNTTQDQYNRYLQDLEAQYKRRAAPTSQPFPTGASTGPQFAGAGSPGKQFSDPITSAIEDYAARRAEERASPTANSGQAALEQALREISAQFRGGGFTPAEQQVFQTQALDPIEQMRTARKQQVLQQLSQRGIDPNSGVGMSMTADVDRQFDAMRQQTQRGLAAQSAEETTARMQQAIQMLTGLAGTENNRLNESYQYRQVPMQLADRAFNQASSLYDRTGNPMQGLQAAWLKYQNDENKGDALQELLGYLAAISQR